MRLCAGLTCTTWELRLRGEERKPRAFSFSWASDGAGQLQAGVGGSLGLWRAGPAESDSRPP